MTATKPSFSRRKHEWPSQQGLAGADSFLVRDRTPPFAPGTGSPFVRLPKGTPVNV